MVVSQQSNPASENVFTASVTLSSVSPVYIMQFTLEHVMAAYMIGEWSDPIVVSIAQFFYIKRCLSEIHDCINVLAQNYGARD